MNANVRITEHLPPMPTGWPTDKRSRVNAVDGVIVLMHPERQPVQLVDGRWREIARIS